MTNLLSTAPGNRFKYRNCWIEIFLDDEDLFEPNIELPNNSGVVWLESEYILQNAINKAKNWIDNKFNG